MFLEQTSAHGVISRDAGAPVVTTGASASLEITPCAGTWFARDASDSCCLFGIRIQLSACCTTVYTRAVRLELRHKFCMSSVSPTSSVVVRELLGILEFVLVHKALQCSANLCAGRVHFPFDRTSERVRFLFGQD